MKQITNFDNIFIRANMVGLAHSLHRHIKTPQVIDGVITPKTFPWLFMNHNQQFMRDYYDNPPDYQSQCDPKLDGNYEQVPFASMRLTNSGIVTEEMGGRYVRCIYTKNVKTEHGTDTRWYSANTWMIPTSLTFEVKIKCGSEGERMKIWQEITRRLYKTIRFYIRFEGFAKLPALAGFPENYDASKEFSWNDHAPDDNTRPLLIFDIETRCYLPDIDQTTERKYEEQMNRGLTT